MWYCSENAVKLYPNYFYQVLPQGNQNTCIENLSSLWPSFLLDCSI